MGRRRKAAKPIVVKRDNKVPKSFPCPFCNSQNSVTCKIDKTKKVGYLKCRVCDADYQTLTTYLTEPVDVYAEWIDEAERLAEEEDED